MRRVMVQQEMTMQGITYKQLAEVAHCSANAMRKWLNSASNTRKWERIIAVSNYLGISVDDILINDCDENVETLMQYINQYSVRVRFSRCIDVGCGIEHRENEEIVFWLHKKTTNPSRAFYLLTMLDMANDNGWIKLPEDKAVALKDTILSISSRHLNMTIKPAPNFEESDREQIICSSNVA